METSRATINTYDYSKNNSYKRRMKITLDKVIGFIAVTLILVVGFFIAIRYNDEAKLIEIDKMLAQSINNMQKVVSDPEFTDTYKLVTFPDDTGIVSENGQIKSEFDTKLPEFEDGYIMMYSEREYYYELQYEGYCITKELKDEVYKVNIFKKCSKEQVANVKK